MFKKVDPKLNLPEEEEKVLKFWKENDTFEMSLEKDSPKGNFVFYEGPPTANGKPGIHHVLTRAFKDLFSRYKTMQGYNVVRKAGWDTQGLPVELQVEKEMGISGKQDIENIIPGDKNASIAEFNKRCRDSVFTYRSEWEKMTERMAYWLDMKDPYVTYDPKYIETVWWVISEANKQGLLYKGHKVVPYCPRCGTALSSHEVAQGYKNIKEESVYIKVKSAHEDAYFLVWTTTPWTLSGNSALAFGPNTKYVLAEKDGEKYILSQSRFSQVLPDAKVIKEMTGKEIAESSFADKPDYEPIYPDGEAFSEGGDKVYKLIVADFVTDADGTGIVHIAPAFGEDDYEFGFKKQGIKVLKTVDEKGTALAGGGKGSFVKDADEEIKIDLEKREILFKKKMFAHDYPFCWRCDSPLLYFAKDSWYIAMSKLRDNLIRNNEEINWNPAYLKNGRFGNWLTNINDWAISRDRYWGTPLPIWICEKCGDYKVVSSLKEIGNIDPHKPFVDGVEFDCEKCDGKMKRTPEVMDVWFDSGSMPFAQYHYPFENEETWKEQFPADFICEAIDQTRGWFYTLLAISTIVKSVTPYKNVISTGHVLDDKGQKMSKSKGNIVEPEDAFTKYGADVVRFFLFSVNQPGEPKLFSEKEVLTVSRNLVITLWNVYSFFMMYASIDKIDLTNSEKLKTNRQNALDTWILAKYNELVKEVGKSLDGYDTYKPANLILDFVNELSTWYVRRSRRRFWKSESDADKESAYHTLYEILIGLSKILAPFTPMFAETMYAGLKQGSDPQSVHLCDFPLAEGYDPEILAKMKLTREIVEAGLSARSDAKIKVRQPLAGLKYFGGKLDENLEAIIAEEVNVKKITNAGTGEIKVELDTNITDELKIEGMARELIRNIQSLRKKSGFDVENRIELNYESDSEPLNKAMNLMKDVIAKEVLTEKIEKGKKDDAEGHEEYEIDSGKIWIGISRIN